MERVKKAGGNLTNGFWGDKISGEDDVATKEEPTKEVSMVNPQLTKEITLSEFRQHDSEKSPWFVINGQVYDGTNFLSAHPGGAISIISAAGQGATEEFLAIHSENAKAMMPEYHIGSLSPTSLALLNSASSTTDQTSQSPIFLHPKTWTTATLTSKKQISPDTKIFTFTLAHPTQTIGLPVGQHLMMRLRDLTTNDSIIRPTPPFPGLEDGVAE